MMPRASQTTIFNRYFVLIFITSVCFCLAMEMPNVVIPLYVTEDLGRTVAVSGLMTTFYTVASAVSRPFNGMLTDKFKRRTLMVVGCALYAAGIFLCGFLPLVLTAFCFRVIQGVGYSTANMAASNIWLGALIDCIDFTTCYRLSACGYVLAAFLAVLVFRKWKSEDNTGGEEGTAV